MVYELICKVMKRFCIAQMKKTQEKILRNYAIKYLSEIIIYSKSLNTHLFTPLIVFL